MSADGTVIPFSLLEEFWFRCENPREPANMHGELRVPGQLDEERLRAALAAALAAHPMTRARRVDRARLRYPAYWQIVPPQDLALADCLMVRRCDTDEDLAAVRAAFFSTYLDIRHPPALRLLLAQRPGGDSLLLSVNHALCDGIGTLRFLRSIARGYAGDPDPPTTVDALGARDPRQQTRDTHRTLPPRPVKIKALLPTTLAPEPAAEGVPAYGFVHISLSESATSALDPHRLVGSATTNDLQVAALIRTIDSWNQQHGVEGGEYVIHSPLNLRPRAWRHDVVASLAVSGSVGAAAGDLADDGALLSSVVKQTRWLLRGGAASLLQVPPWVHQLFVRAIPLFARISRPTSVLTNLGSLNEPLDFGPAGATTEFWASGGLGMPTGLLVGSMVVSGHLDLTLCYRHALLDDAAARRLGQALVEQLYRMGTGAEGLPTELDSLATVV